MPTFDPAKPLVMGRFNTVGGFALASGDPITIVPEGQEPKERGEVTLDTAARLFGSGTFVYAEDARPTPVETPQQAAERLVEVDELDGGWYLIRAPWLGEGEKVQGREAADARRAELVAAGQPTTDSSDTGGTTGDQGGDGKPPAFAMTEGENGWHEITGPGLEEPLKIRGKEAAEAKLAELNGGAAGGSTGE